MTAQKNALPLRNDTILGVCEAIGEDFGFNANWLRVPFAAVILVSPLYAVGTYLLLGVVVAGLRLLIPNAKPNILVPAAVDARSEAPEPLALAA